MHSTCVFGADLEPTRLQIGTLLAVVWWPRPGHGCYRSSISRCFLSLKRSCVKVLSIKNSMCPINFSTKVTFTYQYLYLHHLTQLVVSSLQGLKQLVFTAILQDPWFCSSKAKTGSWTNKFCKLSHMAFEPLVHHKSPSLPACIVVVRD